MTRPAFAGTPGTARPGPAARSGLAEEIEQRGVDLVRLLEKEGDHLADVRDRLSGDLVDAGYRWTADYGRSALGDREDLDVEALAVVLVGGLVNYRRTQWTFGRPPLALSEERLVAAMTTIVSLVLQAGGPETA